MHQLGCAIWLEASWALSQKPRPPLGVTPFTPGRGEFLDICKTMPEFAEIAYCSAARAAQRDFFERTSYFDSVSLLVDSKGYPVWGHLLHSAIITSAGDEL